MKSHGVRPYDLIVLDIIMPKISGMDTAAALRKTDVETPVLQNYKRKDPIALFGSQNPSASVHMFVKAV